LLIERTAELTAIDGALADARAGNGRLVLIEGPAGIGKTALLGETTERARSSGVLALSARGAELELGFPYGLVRQLLEPTLREADAGFRERLLREPAGLATGAILGDADGTASPADQVFSVVHGLYWLIANLAAETPIALLIDDVHWADPPSLRFLNYLAPRLDGLPATVIAALRTGEGGSDESLVAALQAAAGVELAQPAPLTEEGVASFLAADFGVAPAREFVAACHQATGGNPFFVRELAAALRRDRVPPTAATAQTLTETAPPTITRAVLALLGRLPPDAAALARAIAVLGGDASLARAAALSELGERAAIGAMDGLVAADLIRSGHALEFRHPIVRTAIYDEIAPGVRATVHRRVAALLTEEGAAVDTVAAHLLACGPIGDPDTIATLTDAATHALGVGAPESAAGYLARALEEGPARALRASLMLQLATAEQLAGRPSAPSRFEEVRALAEAPEVRAAAAFQQATIHVYGGDWDASCRLLDGALAELADDRGPLRLGIETYRAALTLYDSRLVKEFDQRRPILDQLVAQGGPGTRALALLLAACGAQRDESRERVTALVELGWGDGRYLDDGETLEILPQGIASLILMDELDRAEEMANRFRSDMQARGSVVQYVIAALQVVLIECRRGNLVSAAAELQAATEQARELELPQIIGALGWHSSDVLLERPDVAEIAALVEAVEPVPEVQIGALALLVRGKLRFIGGDRTAAIADLRRGGAIIDALGFTNPFPVHWRSALALMLEPSERDEALALAHTEFDQAQASGQPRRIGIARHALGLLEPDRDAGRAQLEQAVAVLATSPARLEHARALVDLGASHRRAAERVAAREPLREGLDLAVTCGAVRLADRARTELAATGARPRRERTTGRDSLTPSELRIALLAADGRTSQEIAQSLFVTTKTIDMHLGHTYSKLGINSRKQLAAALAEPTLTDPTVADPQHETA
jgi:DNA-binding CsgD family transcriptional regulator